MGTANTSLSAVDRASELKWIKAAEKVRWNIRPFIGGAYRDSLSEIPLNNINPATESVLCQAPEGSAGDIDAAVRSARDAVESGAWSGMSPRRRCEILCALAELIVTHKDEIALLDTLEMGKPILSAIQDAQSHAPTLLCSWAGFADKLFGDSVPLSDDTAAFNIYEPRGVIGAITPWNFPIVNAVYKIAPALAAGNSIVLKPSELTPSSALMLAELAMRAGVPKGVFNVVPGLGATVGAALASHGDVDLVSFTGSTETGRRIMALAGQSNGKPVLLECGGKSPQIVFEDARDLEFVANAIVANAFWNQGQVCSAHTRLIVQESIKEKLLERIVSHTKKIKPADPLLETTAFGSLASASQRARVKSFIDGAINNGARALLLGNIQDAGGCFVSPTIFDGVEQGMSVVQEEIFGPVLCAQGFESDDKALELANGTKYGLAATVWTNDAGRTKRMARTLRAGSVHCRTGGAEGPDSGCVIGREPQKASGFGTEVGLRGLQSYSTLKFVKLSGE